MTVTLLSRLGFTGDLVRLFKYLGIVVEERITPRNEKFTSPSSQWFVDIADRYTPPLSPDEAEEFRSNPRKLSARIVRGAMSVVFLSYLLNNILDRSEDLEPCERAAASYLSLVLFHGCFDYCYLKYDRHLEYHDYPESPVGYYWRRFMDGIDRVAALLAVERSDVLNTLLSSPLRLIESRSRLLEAGSSPKRMMERDLEKCRLLLRLYDMDRDLGLELLFLSQVLAEFMDAQEIEGSIMSVSYGELGLEGVFSVIFRSMSVLRELFLSSPEVFSPRHRGLVEALLEPTDPVGVFTSARRFLELGPSIFREDVADIIRGELERWS